MNKTEIFYHGTCHLFDKFSLSFLGSGEGKSKFGQGIYITSSYKTAALYASKAAKANGKESYYVYTVEVPKLTDDNHVFSCKAYWGLVTRFLQFFVLGTLVPDNASTDDQCHRRHQHQAVVQVAQTLQPFVVEDVEAQQCTCTEQFTEECYDDQDLSIAKTVTDTVQERFPWTVHHSERFQATHQDTVGNDQTDVN